MTAYLEMSKCLSLLSQYICRGVTVQYGSELVSDVTENRVVDGDGGVVTENGTVCTRKCGMRKWWQSVTKEKSL